MKHAAETAMIKYDDPDDGIEVRQIISMRQVRYHASCIKKSKQVSKVVKQYELAKRV